MSQLFTNDTYLEIAKPFRLQWEAAQKNYVLLYPEGMIQLNQTAGLILHHCCDEQKTVGHTISELSDEFGDPNSDFVGNDVYEFLEAAYESRWIKERS